MGKPTISDRARRSPGGVVIGLAKVRLPGVTEVELHSVCVDQVQASSTSLLPRRIPCLWALPLEPWAVARWS